jgi:hypothetical protein
VEELSLLQPGVSGYFYRDNPPPGIGSVDLKEFKSICHYAARQWGGEFLGARWGSSYISNYYLSWFQHEHDPDRWVVALLNAYYPFLSFSLYDPRSVPWGNGVPPEVSIEGTWFRNQDVFSDPALTDPFSYSYRLLNIVELRERLQFTHTSNTGDLVLANPHRLPAWEVDYLKAQSRLWHPEIVAEVVYNTWG